MKRSTFEPSPLSQVECHPDGDRWTVVFVRDLRHPPEKVWAALIEPAQLREWAPYGVDRPLDGVGDVTLTMIDGDVYEDLPAFVSRAEPPVLLQYTWGNDLLRWELAALGSGTRLTLRHTVEGREWAPKVAAGWHICLDVAERLLDGRPVGPIRGRNALDHGWEELHAAYTERLDTDSARE